MKQDKWKYVSVGKCIGAIIWSIIGLATIFIPFIIDSGLTLTYTKLPILGDSSIFTNIESAVAGFGTTLGLSSSILNIVYTIMCYSIYAFLGILAITIVFGLLLAIIRANALRVIFKVFSIFFGIILIFVGICFILFIFGTIMAFMQSAGSGALENIGDAFLKTGLIYALVSAILSFILAGRQFKFFSKPY